MEQISTLEQIIRGVLLALVLVFFLFPIFWILLMSFQTNEQILRIPPSLFFEPTLQNYTALISGKLETDGRQRSRSPSWQPLATACCCRTCSVAAVAAAGRAGGLCLRALQVPAGREHRLHAAVASASRRRCWCCCRSACTSSSSA